MADVDIGRLDCASKAMKEVDVTGTASDTYFFSGSRSSVITDLTTRATNDAWGKVQAVIPLVQCEQPCSPFVLLDGHSMSVDLTDWTRWWSGLIPVAAHYGMDVDVHIKCTLVYGCASP